MSALESIPTPLRRLYQLAVEARDRSYSPYSGHRVGAAIRVRSGEIFQGCNVENSSYGGTCCAERTAIFASVAARGRVEVVEVLVVTDASPPWPPCGLCRQVLAEFASPSLPIHAANLQGMLRSTTLGNLFPDAFTPDYLSKR